jgi:hypothetical protein
VNLIVSAGALDKNKDDFYEKHFLSTVKREENEGCNVSITFRNDINKL